MKFMDKEDYQLRYLPIFFDDVNEITSYVKSYIVYYVVIDDEDNGKIMEVRRLLYNRRDWEDII